MKLQNVLAGIKRVYYLIWGMVAAFSISLMICGDGWWNDGKCGSLNTNQMILAAIAVVCPGMALFAIRWIYRGFVPTQLPYSAY